MSGFNHIKTIWRERRTEMDCVVMHWKTRAGNTGSFTMQGVSPTANEMTAICVAMKLTD